MTAARRGLLVAAGVLALGAGLGTPLAAQPLAWKETDTAHFRFIYEPRDRGSVDELLSFAEDVYTQVTSFWGSYPARVPCVIRGRRDDANGVTQSFPFRIDLYVTAPTDFALGSRSSSWMRLLLTHELTHFVNETMSTGILFRASRVFGADVTSAGLALLPGWDVEGPAVYDETRFTEGGRGRSALFEVYLKAAAEEDRFFSLAQAGYPSDFPPPDRIYVGGYAFSSWLQETYGPDTLRRIMDAYLDLPFLGPWAAISRVTGRSADAAYADMLAALRQRYAEAGTIRGGARITPGAVGNWTRPVSTERGLLAYHEGPDLFPSVVRVDPDTGKETVLARIALTDDVSFSATRDGRTIWMSSFEVDFRRAADVRTVSDLFVLGPGDAHPRRFTRHAHLWHPAVSADGGTLVAVQGAGSYSRLVLVDTRTGSLQALFSLSGANVYNPAVSPDGRQVAFVVNAQGMQGLYVADLDALERGAARLDETDSPVTDVNAGIARPVVGPEPFGDYFPSFLDEHRLLFSSDRSGSLALYTVSVDTGELSVVQEDPVAAIAGAVEQTSLVYTSYSTQGYCLKRADVPAAMNVISLPGGGSAPPRPAPAPVTGAMAAGSAASIPYHDVPLPLLWLPDLALRQTGPGFTDLAVGVGAWAGGASLLGQSRWELSAAWMPGPSQPTAGADVQLDVDALHVSAASQLDYEYSTTWTESVDSSLRGEYALVGDAVRDSARFISVGAGIRHHAELSQAAPFTFADSLAAPGAAWYSYLAVPAIVNGQWAAGGAARDLLPSPAVDSWLQATTFLPLLSRDTTQEELDLFTSVRLPSVVAPHVLSLGVKAVQDVGVPGPAFSDSFTVPRGFTARTRGLPGGALVSVDYFMPALLDQPLVLGWAMTAAAFDVHVEGVADYDVVAGRLQVQPDVFAGVELSARFVYGTFELPVGVGLTAAVSTSSPASFDPAQDLRLYVFAGFDGFSAGARGANAFTGPADRGRLPGDAR